MFERFTEKARAVVVLAQEEARLLDHDAIGTEHVLLALLAVDGSIAGQVLAGLGLSQAAMREDVEAAVGRGPGPPASHPPFTPDAKKLLEYGLREAQQLGQKDIGTEHLLLALARDPECLGAQLLLRRGIDQRAVRHAVVDAIRTRSPHGPVPTGPRLDRCSFCGRTAMSVAVLLRGDAGVRICDRCVAQAARIIDEAREEGDEPTGAGPTPPDEPA